MKLYLPEEMRYEGLLAVNLSVTRINKAMAETNDARFKAHYGVFPSVCCCLWKDLQTTSVEEARIEPKDINLKHFFMALHTLRKYPTEYEREAIFDISIRGGRDWSWFYVRKIQALKAIKVVWPEFGPEVWIISVDGQHCWKQEPSNSPWSLDRRHFSFKYHRAGWCYELALSLADSKLVWMNGPFPAGMSDQKIFKEEGLQEKLVALGKKAIADSGYSGPQISTRNEAYDSDSVRIFKSRALLRQEKFNGRMKTYESLSSRFRHEEDKFKSVFEAIAVLCVYEMENGMPMYDILIPAVLDADEYREDIEIVLYSEDDEDESSEDDSSDEEDDTGAVWL
mmetsp:Transcript_49/g.73  ORF Transcript_49/g.73 Transcript_49/m.73 type:complete len:339 (+) Transcript_49:84-1100(+)